MKRQYDQLAAEQQKSIAAEMERQKAEAANEAKTVFLAHMNHEIRTPLAAISGFTDILTTREINEQDTKKYLGIIKRNIEHLKGIIADILNFSKIESGKAECVKTSVPIRSEISSVLDLLGEKAREKDLALTCEYCSELPACIETDPTHLRQMLINLISNALKFTDRGHVALKINCEKGQKPDEGFLKFEVEDTGCGIPEDMREKIFEPFTQVSSARKKSIAGTGLGLALTRRMARNLGGDLILKSSEEGVGSVFELSIFTRACEPHGVTPEEAQKEGLISQMGKFARKSLLVVEDNEDTQLMLRKMLEGTGLEIKIVANGREALTLLEDRVFDLIFMDLEMPVLNGYDAFFQLRKNGVKTPVIAFTANAIEPVRDRIREMGFNGFITKPATEQDIMDYLEKFLSTKHLSSAQLAAEKKEKLSPPLA